MNNRWTLDHVLVHWGERLFYSANRIVKPAPPPRLRAPLAQRAGAVRQHIQSVVVRRAPQAVIKVAGGGRGMREITAHFKYISRASALDLEDDRGIKISGKEALRDLADQWRYGGSFIEERASRREALNLVLSMPAGTDAALLMQAVRDFAQVHLAGHRYVMALHEDQRHPHVHLTVRKEASNGARLQTWRERHQWRDTFAEKLRLLGIDADATAQRTRGITLAPDPLWRARALEGSAAQRHHHKTGPHSFEHRAKAVQAWSTIMHALASSEQPSDRELAQHIANFLREMPFVQSVIRRPERATPPARSPEIEKLPGSGVSRRADPEPTR